MSRPSADRATCDVAIVGLGPVGATLANLLGMRGVSTIVLERDSAAYHLPRVVHFDDEVMRVFQTIGLNEEIGRIVTLSPGMRFVDPSGKLLIDWSRPAEISAQGWYPSYRFHQPDLERCLRDGLSRWPGVEVRERCDVFALDQDESGVDVRYENLGNGRLHSLRARYVVGCDGARSLARRFMNSEMLDLGFHERWLVIDILLRRPRPDLGDYSVQHCDAARPATYVRGTGDRRRWEIALKPDEDSNLMITPAQVWRLLAKWIGADDAAIERAAVYTFHSVLAETWREGSLFIAGDSAHQTPPFLGQGMCAGIRDAANLAWKLEGALRGDGGDALLDSYQSERLPQVRSYIELAVRLGAVINATVSGGGDRPARMESTKPPLGQGLSAGQRAMAGGLAPQAIDLSGARLDDATGFRFALFTLPAFTIDPRHEAWLDRSDIHVVRDPPPSIRAWLRDNGVGAVVVRPDRYVLGGAEDAADLADLLERVASWTASACALADAVSIPNNLGAF